MNKILCLNIIAVLAGWLMLYEPALVAKNLIPPDDSSQSIRYWKPYIISADKDELVAYTQGVFSALLRAWDSSRLEPTLHVVDSSAGPWAAALADGNILISRKAIETTMSFGKDRAEHLLAFVLAHELAHQRSDDLWHQRFFRLIGQQSSDITSQMQQDIQLSSQYFNNIEEKEARADHDSLIMMSSVGYDPYQVLDKKDFFTAWVENIWQNNCTENTDSKIKQACMQARNRALRARLQLSTVATQAMLYELGVQAFTAKNYPQARSYFTAYGRDNNNRAVLSALALSYFAEAIQIQQQLIEYDLSYQVDFYYPIILDATLTVIPGKKVKSNTAKRSAESEMRKQLQKNIHSKLKNSIHNFEKALRLEPGHGKTYLLLAFCYLLDGNNFMARGIIQGKYIPRFGKDVTSDLILAMTNAIEGNIQKAQESFDQLSSNLDQISDNKVIPRDLLIYSIYYNSAALAKFTGNPAKAENLWKEFASKAKTAGNGVLFRLALSHIDKSLFKNSFVSEAFNVNGMRLGDKFSAKKLTSEAHLVNDLWVDGELHHMYRFENGSRYIIGPDQKIISAWQEFGDKGINNSLVLGDDADRPLKVFGLPDRQLHMMSGEYLAYDNYGLAIHLVQNKVAGWFLYPVK